MIAPKAVYVPENGNPPPDFRSPRDPLTARIEKLALEERDAVRRRDWPAAGERATLQEARQTAAARRLA